MFNSSVIRRCGVFNRGPLFFRGRSGYVVHPDDDMRNDESRSNWVTSICFDVFNSDAQLGPLLSLTAKDTLFFFLSICVR